VNHLVLSATLLQRGALRYTPAGLPALDVVLMHQSVVQEDGSPRQVSMEIRAVGLGAVTQALAALSMGQGATFGGFLAASRNGRGLMFHVTSVAPADAG
jgi:primosomal replication protein N